jgi:uncharacterized protein (TIGR02284 family)
MVQKDDLARLLNGLLKDIEDGNIGFDQAAQEVALPEMRILLLDCAYDCAKALNALQQCVRSIEGNAAHGSTAVARQGWIKLSSAAVSDPVLAVLDEIELRHARIEAAFAAVLAAQLPGSILGAVEQEKELIERNLGRINEARRQHQSAANAG